MSVRAKKRFGQNFLTNTSTIQKIVHAISPKATDNLIEIGPGLGALTSALLDVIPHITAIEFDESLFEPLRAACENRGALELIHADALQFDFERVCQAGDRNRIAGNLPYNIATPLIFHLLTFIDNIQDMHFMVQKEVAERLVAEVGDTHYGRLSVMVNYYCETEMLFTVAPEDFSPKPKVQSAVVRLVPKGIQYDAAVHQALETVVKWSFAQRRKTLRNNLKGHFPLAMLEAEGFDLSLRPQALAIDEYVRLSRLLPKAYE